MKRLIDVDKIVFYTPRQSDGDGLFVKWLKEILNKAPPVDAEPVTRCKACADRKKCNHSVTMRLRTGITDCPIVFCSNGRRSK